MSNLLLENDGQLFLVKCRKYQNCNFFNVYFAFYIENVYVVSKITSSLVLELEHDLVLAVEELHGAVIASGEVRAGVQRIYTIS